MRLIYDTCALTIEGESKPLADGWISISRPLRKQFYSTWFDSHGRARLPPILPPPPSPFSVE